MAQNPLRDRALRFTTFRKKSITLSVPTAEGGTEELTFLLKQPTVAQRNRILAEVRSNSRGGDVDAAGIGKSQALAVILCALDPTTEQPVFEEADLESLLAMPAGGFLDELSAAAMQLMTDGEQAAKT
jgi:hypothetical protein